MQYNSIDMAAHIARICIINNFNYNNTKIQKLLYCCYGCFLAKYNERLVDEYPRAWQYGPVFPRVFNYIHKKKDLMERTPITDLPEDKENFLRNIINVFGKYDAVPLSEWSHKKGSPWEQVVSEFGLQQFIPDDIIKNYFKENIVKK